MRATPIPGSAVIVECLSDNRNRTGSDIRSTFSKAGGSLGEPGAVAWQFERKGVILVPKSPAGKPEVTEDELMLVALEGGAEDITDAGDNWQVTTAPGEMPTVEAYLSEAGVVTESAEVTLLPTTTVALDNENDAKKVLRLIDALEDLDDVQTVYANFDIPDNILELVEA